MKTDKLEKFIIENRKDFDDQVPDPGIFDKIQKTGTRYPIFELDKGPGKGGSCDGHCPDLLHFC